MIDRYRLWPIAIIEDRYGGVYAGGSWLAIANYDSLPELRDRHRTRFAIVEDGAHGADPEASDFWYGEDSKVWWLAVGNSPEEALARLRKQAEADQESVRQVGVFHSPEQA